MTINVHVLRQSVEKKFAPEGFTLQVAVLLRGTRLSLDQRQQILNATFTRGNRVIDAVEDSRAGTIIVSTNTASGVSRDPATNQQAGFHDLRDALMGKRLGEEAARKAGRTRQRGKLAMLGINGIEIDDVIFLEFKEIR